MTDPGAVIPADRDPGRDQGSGAAGPAGPATRARGHHCLVRTESDLRCIFLYSLLLRLKKNMPWLSYLKSPDPNLSGSEMIPLSNIIFFVGCVLYPLLLCFFFNAVVMLP